MNRPTLSFARSCSDLDGDHKVIVEVKMKPFCAEQRFVELKANPRFIERDSLHGDLDCFGLRGLAVAASVCPGPILVSFHWMPSIGSLALAVFAHCQGFCLVDALAVRPTGATGALFRRWAQLAFFPATILTPAMRAR